MNNELLLLIKKHTDTLIEQTKTKPQERKIATSAIFRIFSNTENALFRYYHQTFEKSFRI